MIFFQNVILDKTICDGVKSSITNWEIAGYYVKRNETEFNVIYRPEKRKSHRSDIIINQDTSIYNSLDNAFNKFGYKLISERLEGSVIKYNTGDFLSKHTDLSDDFIERMFCVIVQLNDSDDYIGGDFTYYIDNVEHRMDRNIGNVLIMKPEIVHEVKIVEHGERCSLIFWVQSNEVKKIKTDLI
jgi:predicted 2-oxoglutarate/Fe(II)-dependent dioxygenase YbiX